MGQDRLYPIRTHEGFGFYAGRARGGRQLLAAVDGGDVVAALFTCPGDLLETQSRHLSPSGEVESELREWFGWEPTLVRVKRFRIPSGGGRPRDLLQAALVGEEGFAVAPFPLDWQESLDDPNSLGSEREAFAEMVRGWIERENFALYWGNEYHMDSNGQVVGS
jgi:hypothetical protein